MTRQRTPTKEKAAGVAGVSALGTLAMGELVGALFFGLSPVLVLALWILVLLAIICIAVLAGQAAALGRVGEIEQLAFEQAEIDADLEDGQGTD